jgi:hypothetical protein
MAASEVQRSFVHACRPSSHRPLFGFANFIDREWRLTQRPYDLLAFDPPPTLENGKLDIVEQPLSDRLQVSALSLAQRSLIYDARQSA